MGTEFTKHNEVEHFASVGTIHVQKLHNIKQQNVL
jgi:hypothetical protein